MSWDSKQIREMGNYASMFVERQAMPPIEKHEYKGELYTLHGELRFSVYPPIEYPIKTNADPEVIEKLLEIMEYKINSVKY